MVHYWWAHEGEQCQACQLRMPEGPCYVVDLPSGGVVFACSALCSARYISRFTARASSLPS